MVTVVSAKQHQEPAEKAAVASLIYASLVRPPIFHRGGDLNDQKLLVYSHKVTQVLYYLYGANGGQSHTSPYTYTPISDSGYNF